MRRIAGTNLRQMQAVQDLRKNRIIRRQQDQSIGLCPQRLAQSTAALGVARPHDHQTAFGQGARGGHRVGQPVIIRHQRQQTRVEAGGSSC